MRSLVSRNYAHWDRVPGGRIEDAGSCRRGTDRREASGVKRTKLEDRGLSERLAREEMDRILLITALAADAAKGEAEERRQSDALVDPNNGLHSGTPVRCVETGATYPSAAKAAEDFAADDAAMSRALSRGDRVAGCRFERVTQEGDPYATAVYCVEAQARFPNVYEAAVFAGHEKGVRGREGIYRAAHSGGRIAFEGLHWLLAPACAEGDNIHSDTTPTEVRRGV